MILDKSVARVDLVNKCWDLSVWCQEFLDFLELVKTEELHIDWPVIFKLQEINL